MDFSMHLWPMRLVEWASSLRRCGPFQISFLTMLTGVIRLPIYYMCNKQLQVNLNRLLCRKYPLTATDDLMPTEANDNNNACSCDPQPTESHLQAVNVHMESVALSDTESDKDANVTHGLLSGARHLTTNESFIISPDWPMMTPEPLQFNSSGCKQSASNGNPKTSVMMVFDRNLKIKLHALSICDSLD